MLYVYSFFSFLFSYTLDLNIIIIRTRENRKSIFRLKRHASKNVPYLQFLSRACHYRNNTRTKNIILFVYRLIDTLRFSEKISCLLKKKTI